MRALEWIEAANQTAEDKAQAVMEAARQDVHRDVVLQSLSSGMIHLLQVLREACKALGVDPDRHAC